MFVPPYFQTQNLGLGIEPTDICDVTLVRLASRCWARHMCPPPILSRSYAVARLSLEPRLEAWGRAKNLVLLLELGLLNYRGIVHVFQLRGNE